MSPAICYACHVYHACLLYASFTCFLHLSSFIACLLVSCLCLCMYTHGARAHGVRAQSPRHKQKGRGCEHVDISQAVMFSLFRGLASPIWFCSLLNPFPSSLISLLDRLYWVNHVVYYLSSSLEYGDPCLLFCTYILGHTLGM